ncbi:MAG TPA: SDR family NAD(P)-dependent oxidoreductase [Oceanipulchritudo sp.]|nr:SDR family NAD(P)-dependent oxidoreductase [Oceanipulchritudo sp.]
MPAHGTSLSSRYPSALVTGASSGIGHALAQALLREGLIVYGTSRQPASRKPHPEINWLSFDGSSPARIDEFIKGNGKLLSSVDILINSAGSSTFGDLATFPEEALSGQFHLLLEAPARLTRAVLPAMRGRGQGAVVNITSLAAGFPLPYMAAYTAGKCGLSGFTQSLILTESHHGITLLDFQAGDFRTAFNDHMSRRSSLPQDEATVWNRVERHLREAPPPEKAAADIVRALRRGRSGIIRSGGFFQTRVAVLGLRLLPRRILLQLIRRYYGLPRK